MTLENKTILLTGGTGSFGQTFVETVLRDHNPKKIIIFSRDELKQYDMRQRFYNDPRLRFFLGDVRDKNRLTVAMEGVDVVVHAAALKQVPALEYNPFEAIQTNIIGGHNVVTAACEAGVRRVMALSTDKAANPINLYGATKLCSDKLFIQGNIFGHQMTKLSVVRYGNVAGSRGSVVPLFLKQRESGTLTITDARMTRFWITLEQAVQFVLNSLDVMVGGEIFIPKIPSVRIVDLATAMAPHAKQVVTGIRPGEKLHEIMIPPELSRCTLEFSDYYVICPEFHDWIDKVQVHPKLGQGKPCEKEFSYSSDTNTQWLNAYDLQKMYGNEPQVSTHEKDNPVWTSPNQ